MADIFISYSRKDIAFARLIHQSLEDSGLDTWIDWERIPVGENWWSEIEQAIETANLFMFIISKHSVGSGVCKDEIAIALKNNKKVIPIVIDQIAQEALDEFIPDLKKIQWIIFQHGDSFELEDLNEGVSDSSANGRIAKARRPQFDEAVQKLNLVIRTDWEWVKFHTQLQNEAHEWEKNEKHPSYQLRGEALEKAEQAILTASNKEPFATSLQVEFVTTSRQDENREHEAKLRTEQKASKRLRWIIGIITASLAVAVFLGFNWFSQSNRATKAEEEAIAQRDLAIQREKIALSRQLAAQSMNLPFDTGALLSLEATRINDSLEAKSAFLTNLEKQPYAGQFFRGFSAPIVATAFSEDGKKAAIVDDDLNIKIIDVASKAVVREGSFKYVSDYPRSLVFSKDLKYLYFLDDSRTVIRITIQTEQVIFYDLSEADGYVNNLSVSPDNAQFAFSANRHGIETFLIYDVLNKKLIVELPLGITKTECIKFSPKGDLVAICGGDEVWLWDVALNKMKEQSFKMSEMFSIYDVEFDHDQELLAVAGCGSSVYLFDLKSNTTYWEILDSGCVYRITLSSISSKIAFGGSDQNIGVWNYFQKEQVGNYFTGQSGDITSLSFGHYDDYLLSGSDDLTAILWDMESNKQQIGTEIDDFGYHLTYNEDHTKFATSNYSDTITIWDAKTQLPQGELNLDELVGLSRFIISPDDKYLVASDNLDNLVIWDLETSKPVFLSDLGGYNQDIADFLFTPNGQTLIVGISNFGIYTIDMYYDFKLTSFAAFEDGQAKLAISPDGNTLAAISDIFDVYLYDIKTNTLRQTIKLDEIPTRLEFNRDGSILTIGNTSGGIQFWSLDKKEMIGIPLLAFTNSVEALEYSPDGKILAALSNSGSLNIWDVATHGQIGLTLDTHGASDLFFLEGGKKLVTSGVYNYEWNLDIESLQAIVCKRISRNLSAAEWDLYLPGEPYHATCGDHY